MSFRSTALLWLVALAPLVLGFLMLRERRRERIARRFIAERLRGVANPARWIRPYLTTAAMLFAVLALAGPRAGFRMVEIEQREANRVLAIDLSQSMAAEDIGTSRLSAAKAIARRIIEAHPGRIALIAFEGGAEVVAPLTSDSDAVIALLDTLQPGELTQPGSDIGTAILASLRLIEREVAEKADVVLISDGEDQGSRLEDSLREAKLRGIEVSTIVVGSGDGSTIPAPNGGRELRDTSGQIVTTYARADVLEPIARETGGMFFENPFSLRALDPLIAHTIDGGATRKNVRMPVDRFQWPLALAFLAFFCGSLVNRGAE
jgi:Ca-activated chloride channel family protein